VVEVVLVMVAKDFEDTGFRVVFDAGDVNEVAEFHNDIRNTHLTNSVVKLAHFFTCRN